MSKDSLGDRMKDYEQRAFRPLVRRVPVLLRIDGKAFHTWTRGLGRPFDENLKHWRSLIAAGAEADVKRLAAIQPDLIRAIEGLGDKQALAELAHHLPSATGELGFLLGQGGMAGLIKMLDGTPLSKALKGLKSYPSDV